MHQSFLKDMNIDQGRMIIRKIKIDLHASADT